VILPGLTTELISKHLSTSSTTVLCNQDGKNRRCALMREVTSNQVNYDIASVSQSHSNIICSMVLTTESLHSYSDQTGNFPIKSNRGNLYMFVLSHYETNTIHAFDIPNLQAASIWNAWQNTFSLQYAYVQRLSQQTPLCPEVIPSKSIFSTINALMI